MSNIDMETSNARGLGLTEHEVAKLGAGGVIRESVKLFGGLHPSLVWIQFVFVLPFTVYWVVTQYFQQSVIKSLLPDLPPPPAPPSLYLGSLDEFKFLFSQMWLGILLVVVLMIFSFCLQLVIPAAIFYSVGSIFNGRNVTFSDVVRGVPHMWGKLFITAVVNILLLLSVTFVLTIFLILFQLIFPSVNGLVILAIVGVIFYVPMFIIGLMFGVAQGVTCFEDFSGISAFRKAKHMLHDKWGSAVILVILLWIPSLVIYFLTGSPVKVPPEFQWKWLVSLVFNVLLTSYLRELTCISWAVFYFSCRANYELNVQIHHDDGQLEAGYERIAPALA